MVGPVCLQLTRQLTAEIEITVSGGDEFWIT